MDTLKDLKPRYVVPEYASINEAVWYVLEDSEKTYNEMVQSIAIEELAVLENTGETISDEASGEKAKSKIIVWLQKAWQAVKGFFEKAFKFVTEKVSSLRAKMTKFDESKIKKYVHMLSNNDKNGNERIFGEYYEYTNLTKFTNGEGDVFVAIKKYESETQRLFNTFATSQKDDAVASAASEIHSEMSDAKAELLKAIGLSGDGSEAGVQKAVKGIIRGEQVKMNLTFVRSHIDDMLNSCKDPKKIIKDTKKLYNDIKKAYDTSIKSVKAQKKNVEPQAYSTYLPYLKFGKNITTAVAGATLSCAKDKIMSDMKVIMRIQAAINKTGITKPTKEEDKDYDTIVDPTEIGESATIAESSVFSTEIGSLFNIF